MICFNRILTHQKATLNYLGNFFMHTKRLLTISFILAFFVSLPSFAASKEEIDAKVQETLQTFYKFSSAGELLTKKSVGILVFPSIIKAGFVAGGEFGEGALVVDGKVKDYYNSASASFGFQIGAQERSEVILFMDKNALEKFEQSEGWDAGIDGSIAITTLGAGKDFTIENSKEPVIGFAFGMKGLMGNLTLEGTKITRVRK